jgi:Flp pilus assembly protein TadG
VIAIVVALSVSTFLLGFAALAVDLGSAYVRKAELQSIANRLALAGAKGLPEITAAEGAIDQINRTLGQICTSNPVPGVCTMDDDGNGSAPAPAWMTDGEPGNGEVTFFADPDADTRYALTDRVTDLARPDVATAIQVKLAPSTVTFGLAAAVGIDSATLTKSASGRVGTPLGAGILPFPLQPGDLTAGQFCVRDPAFSVGPAPEAPIPDLFPVALTFPPDAGGDPQYPDGVPADTPGLTIDIKLTTRPPLTGSRLSDVLFHFTNSEETEAGTPLGDDVFRVPLPAGSAGLSAQVWATGKEDIGAGVPADFVSSAGTIFYAGGLPAGSDLCQQPSANRGFAQLARPEDGTDLENLEQNVRSGPAVNLVPVDGLAGTIGSALDCVSTVFAAATTCLSVQPGVEFDEALSAGLLGSSDGTPGRLVGDCGNGTTGGFEVDDSQLFDDPGFVNPAQGGSAAALEDRLSGRDGPTAAGPDNRGWLTSQILRCPRLAVMPVIDPGSAVGGIGGKNITSFSYVWIDDDSSASERGLHFTNGLVDSFRGYVVDPAYLPEVVSRSKLIGPFLGGDMPRQVQLIPDLGGAGT